ncbi:MAG: hypothetical protein PHS93_01070 [Candidatus Omnitrophica bacterium]|nr:hypothetical protein [Candidatus Omnitrophota bacterium]MDD5351743.1 hypothetical protein [Candidatus Omnitrophota bacterium]MDD5550954.1 hypothetical protein [Candidatus Omnitrophota bacterium]
MSEEKRYQTHIEHGLSLLLLAGCFLIIVIFFFSQLFESSRKHFWGDETYALNYCVRNHSYINILLNGAQPQGSPAPLDYLACKALDQIKEKVSYFGLEPEVYFRLFANLITALSVLVVMVIFRREIIVSKEDAPVKTAQLLLLLFVPIAFLFNRQVYYYAAEMRPYALWNSIFFIVLAVTLSDKKNSWLLFTMLVLLAFSATAAVFQISSLALAYFIINLLQQQDFKKIFINAVKLFALPFLIVLYYCFHVGKMGFVSSLDGSWSDFFTLWKHQSIIPIIMVVAIAMCFAKKENIKYAIAPLSFLILFMLGPLIFWVTWFKKFFFCDRQFIYYALTKPIFVLTAIKCMPAYARNIKSKNIAIMILIIFCIIGAALTLRPKIIMKFKRAISNVVSINLQQYTNN